MKRLLAGVLCVGLVAGCGKEDPAPSGAGGGGGSSSTPSAPKADFSSAKATVETMFAACKAKDAKLLASCFSPNCEGEFKEIQAGNGGKMFDEFTGELASGSVTGEPEPEEGGKVMAVPVKWVRRDKERTDKIECVKEGNDWKVRGF